MSVTITTQPTDQFSLAAESATFTVAATGTNPPVVYQWYERIGAGESIMVGETGTTLTILTPDTTDSGRSFFCRVDDLDLSSVDTVDATLTIVAPPDFAQEPQPTTVVAGDLAAFYAIATGNGPFSYEWFNDIDGSLGTGGTFWDVITITADDGKNYYVVVTDKYGKQSQSGNALLTVEPRAPDATFPFDDRYILSQPQDQRVGWGGKAYFEVDYWTLDGAFTEPVKIDWYEDDGGVISKLVDDGGTVLQPDAIVADSGNKYFYVLESSEGLYAQSLRGEMTVTGAEFEVKWSVENAADVDVPITNQFSIAWSVEDARSVNEADAFTCPVRTHRGLDADGVTYWIPFYDKSVSCSRGPLVNDQYHRYYWTEDDTYAKYAPIETLKLDTNTDGYALGVPAPGMGPVVNVSGGTEDLEVDRAYVYTYVTIYGEEGPPSEATIQNGPDDATWTLTELETGPTDGRPRQITRKRIYRSVSTANSAEFHFVQEISVLATTFVDNYQTDDVALNTVLESDLWEPPPDDLRGLIVHPNGFFVGYNGRDVYFSEPYRPHAWPRDYVLSTTGDIVGLGIFGATVVICTNSHPYTCTGVVPNAMVLDKHDTAEPCVARYGIVSMPFGVYYPGPNGLMLASPAGFTNATKNLLTKEEWQNRYQVRDFDAARYQQQYVAFYTSTRGLMFDPGEPLAALVDLDLADTGVMPDSMETIFTDEYSGRTFLIDNCNMYEWNPRSGPNLRFDWTSVEFDMPEPVNMGAARIIWYAEYTPPTEEQTTEWRNYNIARMADAPLNPLNYHAVGVVREEDPAGFETFPEIKQPFHWSPLIWVPAVGEEWPYTPKVIMDFIVNEQTVYSKEITHTKMFRLPSGYKGTRIKIRIRSNVNIQSVKIAETGQELRAV